MSNYPNALHQSGSDTVPIFPSKDYMTYQEESICRQPQKHKFVRSDKGLLYRPIQVQNQVIDYELLYIRPGTQEGSTQPFRNVGEHLNQALRTIQVQNRKLIEMVAEIGKEIQKY